MKCCRAPGCGATEKQFGPKIAERDLRRYRRKGPDATSRLLLDAVGTQLRAADAVLDIGAGVGVLSFELLSRGAASATLVDVSPSYLDAADREARERRLVDRVHPLVGDFTHVSAAVGPADVVTMHRVVCCYADHQSLLENAARHARRVLAFSYPRDRWFVRLSLWRENVVFRLRGNRFRVFAHSPAAMDAIVVREGFQRLHQRQTLAWSMDVYVRTAQEPSH